MEVVSVLLVIKFLLFVGVKINYFYYLFYIFKLLVVGDVYMSCYRLKYGLVGFFVWVVDVCIGVSCWCFWLSELMKC